MKSQPWFSCNIVRIVVFGACALFTFGCNRNFFSETAQRDTPEAILFEARKLLNLRQYGDAIAELETLGAADLARREVVAIRASAYAGRCGLEFIELVDSLQNMGDGDSLFEMLLSGLKSATSYDDCRTAEDLIESISTDAAERTTDENLLLTFVSFAKIGAVLAVAADDDDDGIANAAYSACTLSDAEAGEIGTALSHAATSLAGVSGVVDSIAGEITTLCGALGGTCSVTDPTAFSALQLSAIRSATHDDGGLGLGTQPGVVCP